MKLKHVAIKNFKGVRAVEFSALADSRAPRPLTALLGDNGSGKTSILQAIALTLSMATRRTRDMASFSWHGFLPERVPSLGPTCVELVVAFEPEEVALTGELFEAWEQSLSSDRRQTWRIVPPSRHNEVTLRFEEGRVSSPQGWEAVNQFLGRFYVKALKDARPELKESFAKLGDIFWFDQHRNLGSLMAQDMSGEGLIREGWQAGVEQLREYLVGWWGFHTTPGRRGKDFIPLLQTSFETVFPGTRFVGIMPRGGVTTPRANDFYFLIDRDGRIYDLAEMSSGEQAVFPLVYEFVRLDIQRSVVLIDELELHLHPPEQQRLLAALPKIGSDCQFLITTHSEFLSSAIPNEQEVRLDRGEPVPLAKLFVEGALEVQVLTPILLGNPVPQQGGSKYALKARAGTERRENKVAAGYLRDRDFDFDPPGDLTTLTVDGTFENTGIPFGWRWCRHEIENYLIDPAIISDAMAWPIADIEAAIRESARLIRNYEAARWTIGIVRRSLPPHYELKTRPDGLNEIAIPVALDSVAVKAWASNSIESHRAPVVAATDPSAVQASFGAFAANFDDAFVADVSKVLLWFSGKDLLAGMADWLISKGVASPGAFRASLRDWIIANPVRALELLPEWKGMIEVVRA